MKRESELKRLSVGPLVDEFDPCVLMTSDRCCNCGATVELERVARDEFRGACSCCSAQLALFPGVQPIERQEAKGCYPWSARPFPACVVCGMRVARRGDQLCRACCATGQRAGSVQP